MALLQDVRECLHVSSDKTDTEIQIWISAAIADMRRCGVKDRLLDAESLDPTVMAAVVCFCKANYGYDNSEAERFGRTYDALLCSLSNSKANEYLFPEEPEDTGAVDDPSEGNDGGSTHEGDG